MQVHVSPIITEGYMGRVKLIADCIRKYVPEERLPAALDELAMLIGTLERQIVKDLVEYQVTEEIHKYGIENFNRVNGIPEEEGAAGRPDSPAGEEEVR